MLDGTREESEGTRKSGGYWKKHGKQWEVSLKELVKEPWMELKRNLTGSWDDKLEIFLCGYWEKPAKN